MANVDDEKCRCALDLPIGGSFQALRDRMSHGESWLKIYFILCNQCRCITSRSTSPQVTPPYQVLNLRCRCGERLIAKGGGGVNIAHVFRGVGVARGKRWPWKRGGTGQGVTLKKSRKEDVEGNEELEKVNLPGRWAGRMAVCLRTTLEKSEILWNWLVYLQLNKKFVFFLFF